MVTMKRSEMLPSTPSFPVSGTDGNTHPILVLYVDDCPDLANVMSMYLERDGEMMVDTSLSVDEAINKLKYISFDVIVTDYNSKERKGNGLLRYIREMGGRIPFVYFVMCRDTVYDDEALRFGQVSFIEKIGPLGANFSKLRQLILEALGEDRNRMAVNAEQSGVTFAGSTKS